MKKNIFLSLALILLIHPNTLFGWGDCTVDILGSKTVPVGETILLEAAASPAGGECSWSQTPGLNGAGCTASFTGLQEGIFWVTATYKKEPSEFRCSDRTRITVVDACQDRDGDGYDEKTDDCPQGNDCDDENPGVHPGAQEICDGRDNNCNEEPDEGLSEDADGDGHYAPGSCRTPCEDCDDNDPHTYPGAPEICDGRDNDCDQAIDESDCRQDENIGPGPQKGDGPPRGQNNAGEPIDIATGNVYSEETDFASVAVGIHSRLNLTFQRTYNSRTGYCGPLGHGWTHNFNMSIIPGNPVGVRREGGGIIYFHEEADGTFTPPKGVHNTLTREDGLFRFHTIEQITYTFGLDGKLLEIRDAPGNKLTMQFEAGRLASVTDDFGRSIRFEYDGVRIRKVTDPGGGEYLYTYDDPLDPNPNLISVSYPSGGNPSVRRYLYEDTHDSHNLTGVVDENGSRWLTFGYDNEDRAIWVDSPGRANHIDVDYSGGDKILVTNALGKKSVYTRETADGMAYITRIEEASENGGRCSTCGPYGIFQYGEDHKLVGVSDAGGHHTTYTYDESGNILSETEAKDSEVERTTSYTYHGVFRKPLTVTVSGVDTPGKNKVTEFRYDDAGNVIQKTEKGYANGRLQVRTSTFEYNERGQITTIDGPRTDVEDITRLTYYPNEASYGSKRGRLHEIITPSGITEFLDYDPCGHLLKLRDPNGVVSSYSYSPGGRLESREIDGRTYHYSYDGVGQLIRSRDSEGRTLLFRYEGAHRLKEIEDPLGNRIRFTLDAEGNRVGEEILDPGGVVVRKVSMEYDRRNRLERLRHPDGTFRHFIYDPNGNPTALTDENGRETRYEYDGLDRLLKSVEYFNEGAAITQYHYDLHDNLIGVTDAEGHVTTYDHDDFRDLLTAVSPDTGKTVYRYDEAGNMVSKTDAKGVTVRYEYDALDRLTKIDYPNDPDVIYSYDEGSNGRGRMTGMRDGSGTYSFGYDSLGNLIREEKTIGNVTYTTEYRYDGSGLITGLTYPGGRTIDYDLDEAGRVRMVTSRDREMNVLADNISYRPFGPMTALTYGNGLDFSLNYDLRYRLRKMNMVGTLDFSYDYDGAGSIQSITDHMEPGGSQTFSYDGLKRLAYTEGTYGPIGYAYDRVGNRMTEREGENTDAYLYTPGTNRLSSITGANPLNISHDANGNIVSMGNRTFTYGENNRLIEASENRKVTGRYVYNGFGLRTIKGSTHYHYDLEGRLMAETNAKNGRTLREYIYVNSTLLAVMEKGKALYVHTDHLGTPIKATDERGNLVWDAAYKPFGEGVEDRHSAPKGKTLPMNLRFPGQYYDEETGLHYNWNRYYDPKLGRYLTPDPIGLAGGINPYVYAQNDPINAVDPLGLFVLGSYDRSTGQLSITDLDKGNSVTILAESGGKPFGDPIPYGTYNILERQGRLDFYRLDKEDVSPYDDVDDATGRSHFRLHHPGRTIGCIAAKDWEGWKKVNNLIKNTQHTDKVPDNFKPWWKFWPTASGQLTRYGTLRVY
ncbi:MAG: DUF2778 domain-containing protein [Deltaproteobacteria bacterium]|nr:DUF2778 domain-containing protein [Deltaproteobacteria bacterium]